MSTEFDIGHINGQADALFGSFAFRFNSAPNPQIAAQAMQVGATPDVVAAINNDDPNAVNSLGPLLSSDVGSPDGSFAKSRNDINKTQKNPWSYDRDAYRKAQDDAMSKDGSLRDTFADIHGVPIANIQYANDTLYWVKKDNKQAKAWQQHLIDAGIYADPMFGNGGRRSADGSWTDADGQALNLYLAKIGEPDAMYSKDPQVQMNAAQSVHHFYGNVGLEWTVDGMRQVVGRDKKTERDYKDQQFLNWLAVHPAKRDDSGALQNRINEYVDLYGKNALPANLQELGDDGGVFGKIFGIPGALLRGIDTASEKLADLVPLPGPKATEFHKRVGETEAKQIQEEEKKTGHKLSIKEIRGLNIDDVGKEILIRSELTPEEINSLAPVISKAVNGSDYLSQAAGAWSTTLTKVQLATIYAAGDLISGKDFSSNPFDSVTRAWAGGTAHEDNFMVGLVGQKFVDDHPNWSTFVNTGAGFIDPTLVLGPASRVASFGKLSKTVETASALSREELIKNGVPLSAVSRLNYAIAPKQVLKQMRKKALPDLVRNLPSINDRMIVLDASTIEQRQKVLDLFHDPKTGSFNKSLSNSDINQIVEDHFDHVALAGSTWYNFRSSLKMLSPNVMRRMDEGRLSKAMAMGVWDHGHRSLDFSEGSASAIEKMMHDGMVSGMPLAEINKVMDRILLDPSGAVDIADRFYKTLKEKYIPKDVWDNIQKGQASKWAGRVPDSVTHQYAVHPRGPASPSGTEEISRAPLRVDPQLQHVHDTIRLAADAMEARFMNEVERYQTNLGFAMGGNREANAPIVERFLADPGNKAIADKYMAEKAEVERAMADLVGSSSGKRGAPMLEQQLAASYHAPFSTWEIIAARSRSLRLAEMVQEKARLDAVMNMWKLWTLAKPSSAIRAMVGDDAARVAVTLAFAGSPKAAAQEAVIARLGLHTMSIAKAPLAILSPLGKSLLGVSDHFRQQIKMAYLKKTGMTAAEAEEAAKGWYAKQVDRLGPLAPEMHRLAEIVDHTGGFHPVGPGQTGHAEALRWWVGSIGKGPGREWARIYDEEGADAAREFLIRHRTTSIGSGNLRLAEAKGATRDETKVIESMGRHAEAARDIQERLDQLDAAQPRYVRGPKAGKPNFQAADYRQLYARLPKLTGPSGAGAYRDRVVARIKYHESMSKPSEAIREQAVQEHAFYEQFANSPELRDMIKAGRVDQKKLNSLVKNPVTRPGLPWVVATEDTPQTRAFFQRLLRKPADATMEHVFRPMVTTARADGMHRIYQWWKEHLSVLYGEHPQWDASRIEKEALGMAQVWMKNNTYQGARTIGSYALRNVFPFSGSVLNQNQFWIRTFKAHPWAAGVAANLGIKAHQHRKDRVDIPNPLGWAMVGGDRMTINPIGWSFIGSEGMGSFVPGLGPFFTPFAAIAQQDATAKQVMDMVPGWSEHLPQTTDVAGLVSGAVPSYLRKGLTAAEMAIGLTPAGAEKQMADRMRLDEAMGRRPDQDTVRREVEIENLQSSGASWILPVQPRFSNPTIDLIKEASADEAKGRAMADIRKDPKYKDISPYLEYTDPATDPARKQQIAAEYPQVLPYTVSVHETKGTAAIPSARSYEDYAALSAGGSEHYVSAGEFDKGVQDALQTNQFFQAYDQAYVATRDQFFTEAGVSRISDLEPEQQQVLKSIMENIKTKYPLGYDKFIGGSKALSDQNFSSAIGSLNTFYHMPINNALDSQGVNKWRTVSDLVDQTVTNIVDAKQSGASAADLQQLADDFHAKLIDMFGADPTFLDDIGVRYHWASWKDFLAKTAKQRIQQEEGS